MMSREFFGSVGEKLAFNLNEGLFSVRDELKDTVTTSLFGEIESSIRVIHKIFKVCAAPLSVRSGNARAERNMQAAFQDIAIRVPNQEVEFFYQ